MIFVPTVYFYVICQIANMDKKSQIWKDMIRIWRFDFFNELEYSITIKIFWNFDWLNTAVLGATFLEFRRPPFTLDFGTITMNDMKKTLQVLKIKALLVLFFTGILDNYESTMQ